LQLIGNGSTDGLFATTTYGYGVYAQASDSLGTAIRAEPNGGIGVYVYSQIGSVGTGVKIVGATTGVDASASGLGVKGYATSGDGVEGKSDSSSKSGVWGHNTNAGYGVSGGTTGTGTGVYGSTTGSGTGVYGSSSTGRGIYGVSGYSAIEGSTSGTAGAWMSGVYGHNDSTTADGIGIAGRVSRSTSIAVYGQNTASGWAGYFDGNLQVNGTPYCAGCTAFTNNSDSRLKKNIRPLEGTLDLILKLHGVTFEWIEPEEHGGRHGTQRGFVAQEVEKVVPEWVGVDTKGFKTLNTTGLEAILVESVRALKTENDGLRAQLSKMEGRLAAVERNRGTVAVGLNNMGWGLGAAGMLGGVLVFARCRRIAPRNEMTR